MAYSELIKDFKRTRQYVREFYVYGFRTRESFTSTSLRTYDDERRRIASWLGNYLQFRDSREGRRSFLSIDSRDIPHNPLFRAFQAKSFTDRDLYLHFFLLDILQDGKEHTSQDILDCLYTTCLEDNSASQLPDEMTVTNKLREYAALGILQSKRRGRQNTYRLPSSGIRPEDWQDAVSFFSEAAPLGVIGSFFHWEDPSPFRFKHNFLFSVLDSEVMLTLIGAIQKKQLAKITAVQRDNGTKVETVYPARLMRLTQNGREFLIACLASEKRFTFIRLDCIVDIKLEDGPSMPELDACFEAFRRHMWGASSRTDLPAKHIEMDILVRKNENYLALRLQREKRCGTVTKICENVWRFCADVYDPRSLFPWIRSFYGHILRFACEDHSLEAELKQDIARMASLYAEE